MTPPMNYQVLLTFPVYVTCVHLYAHLKFRSLITFFIGCAEMTESMRHKMQQLKRQAKGSDATSLRHLPGVTFSSTCEFRRKG